MTDASDAAAKVRSAVIGNPPDATKKPSRGLLVEGIEDLADAVDSAADDAATALSVAQNGLNPIAAVRLLTTSNVSISNGLENGDTIDGVTLVTGDRVALAGQTTGSQNGVYVAVASGAASRATDADASGELSRASFLVTAGTHAGETWAVNNVNPTVGSTSITIVKVRESESAGAVQTALDAVSPAVAPRHEGFALPIIVDNANIYGAGAYTIFVPQSFALKRVGPAGTLETYNVTLTPAATEKSGYVKAGVASSSNMVSLYVNVALLRASNNAALGAIAFATDPTDALKADYFFVGSFWQYGHDSPHDVVYTSDPHAMRIAPQGPMVVQKDASGVAYLLVPAMYCRNLLDGGSFHLSTIADGSAYVEQAISTLTTVTRRHMFSVPAWRTSASAALVTADGNAEPWGGHEVVEFAASQAGRVHSPFRVVGDVPGGQTPNQFGNLDPSLAPKLYSNTAGCSITDTDLVALGFTKGVTDTVTATTRRVYAGMGVRAERTGGTVFMRAFYQTGTANNFGTPKAFVWFTDGTTQQITLTLEKKISTTAAIYSGAAQLTVSKTIDYWWIGSDFADTLDVRVCGIQGAWALDRIDWIDRRDHGKDNAFRIMDAFVSPGTGPDLLIPPALYLRTGRPMTMHAAHLAPNRQDGESLVATIASLKTSGSDRKPYHVAAGNVLSIDPDQLGSTADFVVRLKGRSNDNRYERTGIPCTVAPATKVASKKILMIGDSLTNRSLAAILSLKLSAVGMTPTFLGTLTGNESSSGAGDGKPDEGREGWAYADYIYSVTTHAAPASSAAYLAADNTTRMGLNPFIRNAVGGDDPTLVFNSKILDFANWAATYSISAPDFVIIALGTNDQTNLSASAATTAVTNGMHVLYTQARAAWPSAKIAFLQFMEGEGPGDARWTQKAGIIRQHIEFVAAAADANLTILPAWLFQSRDAAYTTTTIATADSGVKTDKVTDGIHFGDLNRHIAMELAAAWIISNS